MAIVLNLLYLHRLMREVKRTDETKVHDGI